MTKITELSAYNKYKAYSNTKNTGEHLHVQITNCNVLDVTSRISWDLLQEGEATDKLDIYQKSLSFDSCLHQIGQSMY